MSSVAPYFTIIIATHNRAALLERAIRSVHNQSYAQHQLIVISDMPDQASYAVASATMQPGDIFIERKGSPGPSESRNLGLSLVRGDYFIFLDDDDSFDTGFLADAASALCAVPEPGASFYYTNFEVIHEQTDGHDTVISQRGRVDIGAHDPEQVYIKNFIPNNCVIYPKQLAGALGFDAAIPYEDWDFILNARDRMPAVHLPIYGPRIHKNTSSEAEQRGKANETSLLQCYLAVYGKHPAPTRQLAAQRQALFASLGLDLDALSGRGS